MSAFFTLHRDMPRQGPGCAADVRWAVQAAGLSGAVRVCDAACGPGADTLTLAEVLPEARIEAVDKTVHLVGEAQVRLEHLAARVSVRSGDMADLTGPYDFIWCAGALYFFGVDVALRKWRPALAPGGRVAFSEPMLPKGADPAAREFWEEYPDVTDAAGIASRVTAAGWRTVATREIVGAPWAEYYVPMEARIAGLRPGADADLTKVLDEGAREIELWRAASDDVRYLLCVVEPV